MKTLKEIIQEKLKFNSKTEIGKEVNTLDDFCKNYNCEIKKDNPNLNLECYHFDHNNPKISKRIEELINMSSSEIFTLQDKIINDLNNLYYISIRQNKSVGLIAIDCFNSDKKDFSNLISTLVLAKRNSCISETINSKIINVEDAQNIIARILDSILK